MKKTPYLVPLVWNNIFWNLFLYTDIQVVLILSNRTEASEVIDFHGRFAFNRMNMGCALQTVTINCFRVNHIYTDMRGS